MTERDTRAFVCIQCALKVFVEELEAGRDPMTEQARKVGYFEGSMTEHLRTMHGGDPELINAERRDLEQRAHAGFERLRRQKAALLAAAPNN